MTKHVIELNGLKYDALTGKPLTASQTQAPTTKTRKKAASDGPKHLDGFSRRAGASKVSPIAHAAHKQTEKSKTLMRSGVKKPASTKIHAKVAAPAVSTSAVAPKPTLTDAIKPGRAIRAGIIEKSNLISKFGSTPPVVKTEVLAVKPAPTATRQQPTVPAIQGHHAPAIATSVKTDMFQSVMEQAVSHTQPKAKKPKMHHRVAKKLHVSNRVVGFASVALLVLSAGSFLAYQNMPELAMRVASTRAGLNANLPSYQPAGFSMSGPIKYEPGEVTISYKSNSDNRAFNVTQKNSGWNSETLLENFVSPTKQPYQTFQANGRTIYIYDGNKATWVDGGVWFNIDGQTNLNSDQLLRIADSL
jgi:hypothetical protein